MLHSHQKKSRYRLFYQSPIFCACSNFFHPDHDFVLSLVQKEGHWSLCNRKIWNGNFYSRFLFQIFRNSSYVIEKSGMEISFPDFYSRFLETQDFMFPAFIQKIATLTENRFGKKILSSIRFDDFSKSQQVFVKFLWIFRASNVLFLCFGKARETSENVNNFVEYIFLGFSGFPAAQKQHIFGPEHQKNFPNLPRFF